MSLCLPANGFKAHEMQRWDIPCLVSSFVSRYSACPKRLGMTVFNAPSHRDYLQLALKPSYDCLENYFIASIFLFALCPATMIFHCGSGLSDI